MPEARTFLNLVATHQAGVWRYLLMLGCDPHEAEDIAQDTFVAVYRQPFEQRSAAESAAYLRKTAFHLYLKMRRRKRPAGGEELFHAAESAWTGLMPGDGDELWIAALRACVEGLDERSRAAVARRYFEDRPLAAIAAAMETSEDSIKSLLTRAKAKLRECVRRRIKQ